MKAKKIFLLIILLFSNKSLSAISVIEKRGIYFEGIYGYNTAIKVKPQSSQAAIFEVTGGRPNAKVNFIVRFPKLYSDVSNDDNVRMNNFTYGGSVDKLGYGTLDENGALKNIRLGATVKVRAKNKYKKYLGKPKIKLRYE